MRAVVFGVVLCCVGCASLTPAGQQVRVTTNADVVRGCQFVGNVSSSSMLGSSAGAERTQVDLQNATAALGGNVLHLSTATAGVAAGAGARSTGEAYNCP